MSRFQSLQEKQREVKNGVTPSTSTPLPAHLSQHTSASTPLPAHLYQHTSTSTSLPAHLYQHTSASTPLPAHLYQHTSASTPLPAHLYQHTSTSTPLPAQIQLVTHDDCDWTNHQDTISGYDSASVLSRDQADGWPPVGI